MKPAVFDASVAVKVFLPVPGSEAALAAVRRYAMVAPALIVVETASAFWTYVRRGLAPLTECQDALRYLAGYAELRPDRDLYGEALGLADKLDHPVYDCLYLALAQREACPLITADRRLLNLARDRLGLDAIDLADVEPDGELP